MRYTEGKITECLQNDPPFCRVACPFQLDVIDLVTKIQRGFFKAAYRCYQNAVGFPAIVSLLCHQPCRVACPRNGKGGAVELRELERAVIAQSGNPIPIAYNMSSKEKRIAIVGAGISGLGAALRLAVKGYRVTIYEKTHRYGGHLLERLSSDLLSAEIEHQFMNTVFTLHFDTQVTSLDDLDADAVYLATGVGGDTFGCITAPGGAFASNRPGVFMGGSLCGRNSMEALADGLAVGAALERFLKTGGMNQPHSRTVTRIKVRLDQIDTEPAVKPVEYETYTVQQAAEEAGRCLKCSCDACFQACDLMRYFRKFPRRIAEEVEITVNPGTLDGNGTIATRMISTCSQCGLCKTVCPLGIDTGTTFLHSHRVMREKGAMPWAFHDFYLRDMIFANRDAGLARIPENLKQCSHLFFPGCQLGASNPHYVTESYHFLRKKWPDCGIYLGCCGAPAEWAGDEAMREEVLTALTSTWEHFGRPVLILACPSCRLTLQRHRPLIKTVFIYELLQDNIDSIRVHSLPETVSVFDPCASRNEPILQQTVRELVRSAGYTLQPLPYEGREAQCCSWGGQVEAAHPTFARYKVGERISAGEHPYVTYCSNCRDIFAAAGKAVFHVLDMLLHMGEKKQTPPTLSQRRLNRLILKKDLLKTVWQEEMHMQNKSIELSVSPELKKKLSDEMILEEEVSAVVTHCEKSGEKVWNPEKETFSGHLLVGNMTIWAEYRVVSPGGTELCNAYAHRMQIVEERP